MNNSINLQFLELDKVHPVTLKRLKELTIEGDSAMRDILKLRLRDENYVLIARQKTGKIVGWATITHNKGFQFCGINVFVEFENRRQGIGKILFHEAANIIQKMGYTIDYYPWSLESRQFFREAIKGIEHKCYRETVAA